jgi:hypothetical protein
MTKEQYIRVIERVINSPRNDYQKIIMLQQGFELYVAENVSVKEDTSTNPALGVHAPKLPTKMGYSG